MTPVSDLRLAELISSLSYALDLTEGQPEGHCLRACWIGMHVGAEIGLSADEAWPLYYTLLLKDLGCSSNAARICQLYLTDDRDFKQRFKTVGHRPSSLLRFVVSNTGRHAGWRRRMEALLDIARNGDAIAQELIQTRCSRGADIARRLRFPESVAAGIHSLDEHFDGGGRPDGLRGDAIPLPARIALLAQVADVFHTAGGPSAAVAEARLRSESWFDPALVAAFERACTHPGFWEALSSDGLEARVLALEPVGPEASPLDDDYLDAIAEAFGAVVDAKSPFTAGHSERVGYYTNALGTALGIDHARLRWLRRAALLHDVGKLGVSNAILDKPGRLEADEWAQVQRHAVYTEQILERITPLRELARIAAAHHEKLDGTGYPRGLHAAEIPLETRIITTADIFDAITAERPYSPAQTSAHALNVMRAHVGTALDADCFAALEALIET